MNVDAFFKSGDGFFKRAAQSLASEQDNPVSLWYLSCADDEGFRGGMLVEAKGFVSAVYLGIGLRLITDGEVRGTLVPPHVALGIMPAYRNRLLTLPELEECLGPMERMDGNGVPR